MPFFFFLKEVSFFVFLLNIFLLLYDYSLLPLPSSTFPLFSILHLILLLIHFFLASTPNFPLLLPLHHFPLQIILIPPFFLKESS